MKFQLLALATFATLGGFPLGMRYGFADLSSISLTTEAFSIGIIENHQWVGDGIRFQQRQGNQFDVIFDLTDGRQNTQLVLQNVDLSLFIPIAPERVQGKPALIRWFLTEREFNRQRVIFEAGDEHIYLPEGFAGYVPDSLAISLTNNCLEAGYWELAVFAQAEDGESEKIYQGYFNFPKGAYGSLVSQLNSTVYWQQARTMEAWPGFRFLSGMGFDLDALRQVNRSQTAPVSDLTSEPIIAANEQIKKADLIIYADNSSAEDIKTWQELRQADLKFQSFVKPGIYDPNQLWKSDYSQLAIAKQATVRQIRLHLSHQELLEVEIEFANAAGDPRRLIISGFDLAEIPQLESSHYAKGVYAPLGFGAPFVQTYRELVKNPPHESPFFSVWLDGKKRVINYRQDIGLNGLVLHRDIQDETRLHIYLLSYERITLVGHYVVDL